MDCLVLPVSILRRRCSGSGYRILTTEEEDEVDDPVTVVVGKEKREFVVDPFVLEESPFRVLMDVLKKENKGGRSVDVMKNRDNKRLVFVDVDSILFEHLLWLMHNDISSLLQLNLKDIVDFYAQDN